MDKAVFTGLLLAVGLGFTGCGKEDDSSLPPAMPPAAPQADVGNPASAPVAAPPPVASAPGTPPPSGAAPAAPANAVPGILANVENDYVHHLVNLNNAYQDFRSIEMRSPRDLNELVTAKRLDKLPPAPPGKQYKIDEANLRIVVVNQQ